jgi:ATP-dependent helicase HrpB
VLAPLPIDPHLPSIVAAVRSAGAAVLVAPPGSGKTTRVPPALLDGGIQGRILVLQPRRVAARLAATRIAHERGVRLGDEVGYTTRFDRRTSRRTRIELITEGLLTRRLQADPFLEGVGCVVLDEFHERSLHVDLGLALLAEVRRSARDDLAVVVMSATLDPGPVARFLDDCPVLDVPGRAFPVDVEYAPRPSTDRVEARCARAVRRLLREEPTGHVLVFLPGVGEIARTARQLEEGELPVGVDVLPLHGRLSGQQQDRAVAPSKRRKVVLATNVAETSVTLEGVRGVVDSGLARVPRFDPAVGLSRLETVPISAASANQRAGRAGRTGPGRCLRLWTEAEGRQRRPANVPEVRRADLAAAALELLLWGVRPAEFSWFEAPPAGQLEQADRLLEELHATRGGALTSLGRRLAAMPAHPRLAAVVEAGRRLGILATASAVAALASERDPFHRPPEGQDGSDLLPRLEAAAVFAATRYVPPGADRRRLEEVVRVRDQLMAVAGRAATSSEQAHDDRLAPDTPVLVRALLAGFPDRVARRRGSTGRRYVLASGSGAELDEGSAAVGEELLIAVDLGSGDRQRRADHRIRSAHPLDRSCLVPKAELELRFDDEREAVVQRLVERWGELVLSEHASTEELDPAAVGRLLAQAAAERPGRALDPKKDEVQLLARLRFVAAQAPELDLPEVTAWADLLPELCASRRSFEQLRKADLAPALFARMTWRQRQQLDRLAPERLRVPSGSSLRVDYAVQGTPVLAARIQQLFGWTETPRVAGGRVRVLLHLLAPNNRPAQVTRDLAGFWASSYAEVRKDLRGRYPKHSWPEEPATATPEDRPRRRR